MDWDDPCVGRRGLLRCIIRVFGLGSDQNEKREMKMGNSLAIQCPFFFRRLAIGGCAVFLAILASLATWSFGVDPGSVYPVSFAVAAVCTLVLLTVEAVAQSKRRASEPERVLMFERDQLVDLNLERSFRSHGLRLATLQYNTEWVTEFAKLSRDYDILLFDARLPTMVFLEMKALLTNRSIIVVECSPSTSDRSGSHRLRIVEASSESDRRKLSAVLQA